MIERLACKLGRNDEQPNIELAIWLCEHESREGVKEVVAGLRSGERAVANDCIKVLYETGYRKPQLIAPYAEDFLAQVLSKNNRMAWGCMIALACIADVRADAVYRQLDKIKAAYQSGGVITVDNCISVFAQVCRANDAYRQEIFPMLISHIQNCRPKEVAQHAERISVCIDQSNIQPFFAALDERMPDITPPQQARLAKLRKKLCKAFEG